MSVGLEICPSFDLAPKVIGFKFQTNNDLTVKIMYYNRRFEANNNVGIFEPTNISQPTTMFYNDVDQFRVCLHSAYVLCVSKV